eukprot:scaffold51242_cov21-Tisochrysis_lutea.AAC.2
MAGAGQDGRMPFAGIVFCLCTLQHQSAPLLCCNRCKLASETHGPMGQCVSLFLIDVGSVLTGSVPFLLSLLFLLRLEEKMQKVIVFTSDVRGAGTDANVEMELWGTKVRKSFNTLLCHCKTTSRKGRFLLGYGLLLYQPGCPKLYPSTDCDHTSPHRLDTRCVCVLNRKKIQQQQQKSVCNRRIWRHRPKSCYVGKQTDPNNHSCVQAATQIHKDTHMHVYTHACSANNFERGQKDMFAIKAPDIGDLTHVIVRKDNSGLLGTDWHLQGGMEKLKNRAV